MYNLCFPLIYSIKYWPPDLMKWQCDATVLCFVNTWSCKLHCYLLWWLVRNFKLLFEGHLQFGVQATKESPIRVPGHYRTFIWKFKVLLLNNCTSTKSQWKVPGTFCLKLHSVPGESSKSFGQNTWVEFIALPLHILWHLQQVTTQLCLRNSLINKGKLSYFSP